MFSLLKFMKLKQGRWKEKPEKKESLSEKEKEFLKKMREDFKSGF